MCSLPDPDGPYFFARRAPKARKAWRCCSCGAPIQVGEIYTREVWIADRGDTPTVERSCAACSADLDAFVEAHGNGPAASYFASALADCIAEGDEESERRWKPMLTALRARGAAARATR